MNDDHAKGKRKQDNHNNKSSNPCLTKTARRTASIFYRLGCRSDADWASA